MSTPDRVGKYQLMSKIARGGMAEIHLARQEGPEGFARQVVVKRMLPALTIDPKFVDMFLDEARIVARLSHPNIIQIFDFGKAEDGSYYIAMEFLEGRTVRDIGKQAEKLGEAVPPEVVAAIGAEACDALHHAHTATDEHGQPMNIVHRDISPANIMVTYQGVVKILDFGIAKAEQRMTETASGVRKGTFRFMSPEHATGDPLDGRADVFALGIVLWETLAGVPLFKRRTDVETIDAVLKGPIPTLRDVRRDISESFDNTLQRALVRDRAHRFATALEMKQALESLEGGGSPRTLLQGYLTRLFGRAGRPASDRPSTATGGLAFDIDEMSMGDVLSRVSAADDGGLPAEAPELDDEPVTRTERPTPRVPPSDGATLPATPGAIEGLAASDGPTITEPSAAEPPDDWSSVPTEQGAAYVGGVPTEESPVFEEPPEPPTEQGPALPDPDAPTNDPVDRRLAEPTDPDEDESRSTMPGLPPGLVEPPSREVRTARRPEAPEDRPTGLGTIALFALVGALVAGGLWAWFTRDRLPVLPPFDGPPGGSAEVREGEPDGTAPSTRDRKVAEAEAAAARAALPPGQLLVTCSPSCEVRIDGEHAGFAPGEVIDLPVGRFTLEVEFPDGRTESRKVTIAPERVTSEAF